MNLADVFTFLFVILGFIIVFVSYWLIGAGMAPEFTARAAARLERSWLRTTLLGAVTMIPSIILGFAVSAKAGNGAVKVLALAFVVVPVLLSLFGSAGWALRIGAGLQSQRDEHEPWRRVLRGGIVLGFSFVLPFIGWFVVMPLIFLSGFGAFMLAVKSPTPAPAVAPVPATLPPPPPPVPAPLAAN